MINSISKLMNYCRTFISLSVDFIKTRPIWTSVCMLGLAFAGALYTLPYALIASAVFAALNGKDSVNIDIQNFHVSYPVINVIGLSLGIGVFTYALNFILTRILIGLNIKWQDRVYWRIANKLEGFARFNIDLPVLPYRLRQVQAWLARATTSCTQIGRLVTNGFHTMVVISVAGCIMLAVDWRVVAVLAGSFILLIPLYAKALSRIVEVRVDMIADKVNLRPVLDLIFENISLNADYNRIELSPNNTESLKRLAPIYSIVNHQYFSLNTIQLLVGSHFFIVIVGIIVALGYYKGVPEETDIILFAALLVFVRSIISLVHLMANLTRNYTNIALLKQFIFPKTNTYWNHRPLVKKGDVAGKDGALQTMLEDYTLIVESQKQQKTHLKRGDLVLLRSIRPRHSFHLTAISNASILLQSESVPLRDNILFIPDEKLELLLPQSENVQTTKAKRISVKKGFPALHVKANEDKCMHPPVICITEMAYKSVKGVPEYADALKNSIVILWVRFGSSPSRWPRDMKTIVMRDDCISELAGFETVAHYLKDDFLPDISKAASQGGTVIIDDIDD